MRSLSGVDEANETGQQMPCVDRSRARSMRAIWRRARGVWRRARFSATPLSAWRTLIGTELAGARLGAPVLRALRRFRDGRDGATPTIVDTHMRAARRAGGKNVLVVSHCDFTGNSAFHVYAIATELDRMGWSPAIAVPRNPGGVRELGRPAFPVLSYRDVERGRLRFSDGAGPDLLHAFTPRAPVRNLSLGVLRRHGCKYVVHLEDNELAVQRAVVDTDDSTAAGEFVRRAAGVTVVIDRLLEFKSANTEGIVVWPGYEPAIDLPGRSREAIREDVGLGANDLALVYCGNVHEANFDEVAWLYEAVSLLRAGRTRVVLVRTGWTHVTKRLPALEPAGLRDLGWISRRRIPELLIAADVLVQPGSPGPFNDYRFPSKLPDFLASGRPVVLPKTNIGLYLEDGVDALLLDRGDAGEILEKVSLLVGDAELRTRLGEGGRAFAVRRLQWSRNVPEVARLYEAVL